MPLYASQGLGASLEIAQRGEVLRQFDISSSFLPHVYNIPGIPTRIRINPLPNSIHISRIYQQVKKPLFK